MGDEQERYTVYASCRKALFLFFGSSVFVVALFFISLKKAQPWDIWLCGAFFGLCMLVGLYRLLDRRPKLILDERGLHDLRTRGSSFPWDVIREVSLVSVSGQCFLSLKLDESHPDVRPPSANAVKLSNFFGMKAFNVNISELRVDPGKLCTTVQILSFIPLEERKALLRRLVETDGLLPGERPEPNQE